MAETIPQRALRNDNAKVIEAVARGKWFVITRNGTPVAELRPVDAERNFFVSRAELAKIVGTGPHIDHDAFRRDLDNSGTRSSL